MNNVMSKCLKGFTVIAVYHDPDDTFHRFAEWYSVHTWQEAEKLALESDPELVIAGIIPGEHKCVDIE